MCVVLVTTRMKMNDAKKCEDSKESANENEQPMAMLADKNNSGS